MTTLTRSGGKFVRHNQRSVYLDRDVQEQLKQFLLRFPILPFSMIVNAAMRCYFRDAKDGIDGNLQPIDK